MMERNTFPTTVYIDAPLDEVEAYASSGECLGEYTLQSKVEEQLDEHTWLGTASGYQSKLYYHVRRRTFGAGHIVEWHCGTDPDDYSHVYPMILLPARYFDPGSKDAGTYNHWIAFVDPKRRPQMIADGITMVHRAEARSMKAHIERRAGHRFAAPAGLELRPHPIYVDAPLDLIKTYLGDRATVAEWGFMLRKDRDTFRDEYDRECDVTVKVHDLGPYAFIEHDTRYREADVIVRAPMLVMPTSYAFCQPEARGSIVHRISAWSIAGERQYGKLTPDEYDAEAINAKRMLEAKAGNRETFARGCSFM